MSSVCMRPQFAATIHELIAIMALKSLAIIITEGFRPLAVAKLLI